MNPAQLQPESFRAYPPHAKALAVEHIDLLRKLPIAFLPLLLREVITYDWKFPAERGELTHQFAYLGSHPDILHSFARLHITPALESVDWVNAPALFSEQLTAHLWATHQIDLFRTAAVDYVADLNASAPGRAVSVPRLGMVVIGQGVGANQYPLFRKLRPHGVHYTRVNPANGFAAIVDTVTARAAKFPAPHSHWYIDGGAALSLSDAVTTVSYAALAPLRTRLQGKIQKAFDSGVGSETLRTLLAQMQPADLGLDDAGDPTLNRFQMTLFTEGSGTQVYSTTFVQWAAREALRRAQPVTLLARFAPRQRETNMRELLAESQRPPALDAAGSLIDADMGAYYTWLNQQRLHGAEQARFLVWFQDHSEAVLIGPGLSKNTTDSSVVSVTELLRRVV